MLRNRSQQILKHGGSVRMFLKSICLLSVAIMIITAFITETAMAKEGAQDDEWQFGVEVYGWAPKIKGETATGSDININLNDIIEDLNFAAMVAVGARKGKWSFMTDIIYMDLEGDKTSTKENIEFYTDVELKAWIVTPTIGYSVVESDTFELNIIGGARYLYLDLEIGEYINTPKKPLNGQVADSGSNWDAIIGLRGEYAFNEKWYMPVYLDVGTGDSEFTWQALAGFGYKFNKWDFILAWRYLDWEFDDSPALDNLSINGPLVGAKFIF